MAYNICVNCGTNLNHLLAIYVSERETFKTKLRKEFPDEPENRIHEMFLYFTNLFFVKANIDRICCRAFFITFNDYVPNSS